MILDFIQVNKIKGYEDIKDFYVICSDGRIINTDKLIYLKITFDKNGYPKYRLRMNNGKQKHVKIHQILAKWLIPNPNNLPLVRHLNDNKLDWRIENLAFGTMSDNMKDRVRNGRFNYKASAKNFAKCRANSGHVKGGAIIAKKLSKPVRCIETGIIYTSAKEAERQTGIRNTSISNCCNGRCKTAGKYRWEWYQPQQAPNNIVDMSDYLEMNTSYRIN